ncbi:glycosylhydrolase-like jelly roll fold domain-containing protein [Paenibacillus allorhizosphaerae]|uniref:Glycosyl hydrolases family 2 sugar binding domain-containing protein n=1 Tax=Paenibacillus allorhizosphaerae TaxID=2849866 RepID=A0ABM8VDG7_9BACL|nr:glycosylhydrolase-like jelly roll fold domain-containing protein [Paenibacillus allorhizosphaerae]CAG7627390.1 hypothetical protein PAECIP111802_01349 [Paenibacillus allorhizosphaerae]
MSESALKQQFLNPSDEFTPIPFWFWNDALTKEEIVRQIGGFAEKGVMGFVIHPRIGIPESIPYLSDTYMDLVEAAVEEAARRGMTVILYDEAMYPSGAAKGFVVQGNPEFASRGLRMAEFAGAVPVRLTDVLEPGEALVSALAVKKEGNQLTDPAATVALKATDGIVSLHQPDSADTWSILLFIETYSKGTIRGIHFGEDDGEPNAPASADLLHIEATRKFIRLTHERYYERLARYFGSTIIAFFTDEPDMLGRRHRKGLRPWTSGFLERFVREGNREQDLPLLWLEADSSEAVRRAYRKTVQRQLTESYYKPLSDWCAAHGIALTGHPAASDDIGLLDLFHIPGQDVVWRWVAPEDRKGLEGHHSTAGKCSADAARHRGRRRNINEFLGVCGKGGGWALTAGDMKWYTDWLLVRGVNMLCPHAFYYSIDGPRRWGERPPDVGPNNIWWPHYGLFARYMKRMSWLMTDSRNVTRIAVLCKDDRLPWRIAVPLYEHQIEFNYLEESLLVNSCTLDDGQIRIAMQSYTVLLVENTDEVDAETKLALLRFRENGGTILSLTEENYVTAVLPDYEALPAALDRAVPRDIVLEPPCADIRVSHVVKGGEHFYVAVNEGEARYEGTFTVAVTGHTERWDAWTGEAEPVRTELQDGKLRIPGQLERRQSVVFRIDPAAEPARLTESRVRVSRTATIPLGDWQVDASDFPVLPKGIGSWTDDPQLAHVSGTAAYRSSFQLNGLASGAEVKFDLGEVHEVAEVWVNGHNAGVCMWHPYTMNITPYVNNGQNNITVHVTNSLACRFDGNSLPSGLVGPVHVIINSNRE